MKRLTRVRQRCRVAFRQNPWRGCSRYYACDRASDGGERESIQSSHPGQSRSRAILVRLIDAASKKGRCARARIVAGFDRMVSRSWSRVVGEPCRFASCGWKIPKVVHNRGPSAEGDSLRRSALESLHEECDGLRHAFCGRAKKRHVSRSMDLGLLVVGRFGPDINSIDRPSDEPTRDLLCAKSTSRGRETHIPGRGYDRIHGQRPPVGGLVCALDGRQEGRLHSGRHER